MMLKSEENIMFKQYLLKQHNFNLTSAVCLANGNLTMSNNTSENRRRRLRRVRRSNELQFNLRFLL